MSVETRFGERILEKFEDRIKFIREVDDKLKKVIDELESYFKSNSNVGEIRVHLQREGAVVAPIWIVEIMDLKIEIDYPSVRKLRVVHDTDGFPKMDKNADIEEGLKQLLMDKFVF